MTDPLAQKFTLIANSSQDTTIARFGSLSLTNLRSKASLTDLIHILKMQGNDLGCISNTSVRAGMIAALITFLALLRAVGFPLILGLSTAIKSGN